MNWMPGEKPGLRKVVSSNAPPIAAQVGAVIVRRLRTA